MKVYTVHFQKSTELAEIYKAISVIKKKSLKKQVQSKLSTNRVWVLSWHTVVLLSKQLGIAKLNLYIIYKHLVLKINDSVIEWKRLENEK